MIWHKWRQDDPVRAAVGRGRIDHYFLLLVFALLVFGTVMSYSASAVYGATFYGDSFYFFKRYVAFALLSIAVSAPFVFWATPHFWRYFAVFLYTLALMLLVLVLLIGTVGGGAQRWLVIGPLTIQPSELAKPALVLMLALVMTFFVSDMFTGVAFDSGGVASGPMTATFLSPLAMGACEALGGNMMTDAFGIVAMVAMTPLVTIQLLGLKGKLARYHAISGKTAVSQVCEDCVVYYD